MIAETTVVLTLGGEQRRLVFDANTMCAYEEATGRFFLDTLSSLYDAVMPSPTDDTDPDAPPPPRRTATDVLRQVSMKDLRALLWAAMHDYDERGEPRWPLTLHQVGRMLVPASIPDVFLAFLRGQSDNMPTREEAGETRPPEAVASSPEARSASAATASGPRGIASLADAFASRAETQEG